MMRTDQLNIIIVEDDAIIAQLIEKHLVDAGHRVTGIAHNSTKALDLIMNRDPDLVILDIDLGRSVHDGIQVGKILHEKMQLPFLYLTAYSDRKTIERAKDTRPCGYIVKPYKENDLLATITIGMYNYAMRKRDHQVTLDDINSMGNAPLSDREYDIVMDIAQGYTNAQIAAKQYISVNTAKWHIQNIYSKLDVPNRTTLIKKIYG